MRILSDDVKNHLDQTVHIEGWLHKKRLLGGLTFISVRDRRGLVQVVIQDKAEVEKLRGLQIGTVLAVDGKVTEEPRADGGAEVFKLDYFGKDGSLAQSPQLYKQIMVGVFERVFEIGPAFRAELSATTRHVSEVTMLDIEMGFIKGYEDVLNMVQDLMYEVVTQIYKEFPDELKALGAPELTLKPKFPHYLMSQIHELYSK